MRTLDINLQIEAMKHETKARPISNLRTSIRYASPDCQLEESKKIAKIIPAAVFSSIFFFQETHCIIEIEYDCESLLGGGQGDSPA